MQEPGQLKEDGLPQIAKLFPQGFVIKQEEEAPYRVQVRIPQYHTGIEDDDLPYYRVGVSTDGNGHNGRSGKFYELTPGTEVICLVYDARGYNGVIVWILPSKKYDIKNGDVHGWRDDAGNEFRVAKDGKMTMTDSGGAKVSMGGGVIDIEASEFHLRVGDLTLSGEMFTALFEQMTQTAQTWNVDASNPTITEGGGSGSAPELTPPDLPPAPDVANKTDM